MGMDLEKQRLSIEAAKLYYQSDYSQQDIAARLGVSRPTVSRLLHTPKIVDMSGLKLWTRWRISTSLPENLSQNMIWIRHLCVLPR